MPAIVVIAYNRSHSLERLLKSIARGFYPANEQITLHISIDHSDATDVVKVAEAFDWKHGEKVIACQPQRLGLLKHVLFCGDLTEKYGEIIVLEDDLVVASDFYNYANQALRCYSNQEDVAGISLFKYRYEENQFLPFEPLNDGTDVHFIQVASSWGQAWNVAQWSEFRSWLEINENRDLSNVPNYMQKWGDTSWKRYFNSYLVDKNRFFAFPSVSLSTNFEEAGTHASSTGLMQVPLLVGSREYLFSSLTDSRLKYDEYFEMLPTCLKKFVPEVAKFNFDVDLFGGKPKNSVFEYRLTTKSGVNAVKTFGAELTPLVANIIHSTQGSSIGLYALNDIHFNEVNERLSMYYPLNDLTKIIQNAEELVSFSVVIPYLKDDIEQLFRTIQSIEATNSRVQIIVATSENLTGQLNQLKSSIEVIKSPSLNLSACLQSGFDRAKNEIVTWSFPGTIYSEDAFSSCERIFTDFRTVHWVLGVKESRIPSNRWSKRNAIAELDRSAKMSSEGSFFRRTVCGKVKLDEAENLFYFLLSKSDVTVLCKELVGEISEKEWMQSKEFAKAYLSDSSGSKGFFYEMLKPWIRARFFRNGTLFSLIYRRKEQLPFVLRYDQDNNSYYLNEY